MIFFLISKNEFTENTLRVFIKNNNTFTLILKAFYMFISIFSLIFILSLPDIYIDIDLLKTTRLILGLLIKRPKYGQANFGF